MYNPRSIKKDENGSHSLYISLWPFIKRIFLKKLTKINVIFSVIFFSLSIPLHAQVDPDPIPLDTIRVITDRTRMIGDPLGVDVIPGSAHILVAEDLQRESFVFDNVHDFLRLVPGVNVQDEDGFGLRPNIGLRGTGVERSSRITLMEDGVLIAPAPYTAPSAYYFPVAGRMEAVEVRKGSSQIKYGPRTIGGAINFVSSSIPNNEFAYSGQAAYGENGTLRGHAQIGGSGENFGWLIEGYSLGTDGFKYLANGGDTGFDVSDFVGKVRINSDVRGDSYQELELKLGYTDHESRETYLGLSDEDFAKRPLHRYPATSPDLMKAEHYQVQLRHLWARGVVDVTTTLYHNDFSRNWYKLGSVSGNSISKIMGSPHDSYASSFNILRGNDSESDALKVRANNRKYYSQGIQSNIGIELDQHEIELGIRIHRDEEDRMQWEDGFQMLNNAMLRTSSGSPGSQSNRVSSADAVAFFLQDQIDLGRLTITPGIRFEHIQLNRTDYAKTDPNRTAPTSVKDYSVSAWIPGVGFSYNTAPTFNLFWGIHRGFAPAGPGAKEATRPESSINYELGGRYKNSGLAIQATGFYSDYVNILGRATLATTGDDSGEEYNGGKARIAGVELSLDYDLAWQRGLSARVPLRIAYTATHAQFRSAFDSKYDPWGDVQVGYRLPYLPPHQMSGSIGYERNRFNITFSTIALGAMRTKAGKGRILAGEGVDAYMIFNLDLGLNLNNKGTIFAGIQNLSDKRYNVARRPAGMRPGLPRTVVVGYRISGVR